MAFDGGLAPHENTYGYIQAFKPDGCKLEAKQKPKWNPGFKIVNAVRDFSCLYDDDYNDTDLKMQRLIMETGGVVTGVAAADPKIEYYKEGIAQNCEKLVFYLYFSFHVDITVTGSLSCSFARQVALSISLYFSIELAEIWSPGTFFEDVRPYKISALYLLYF